MKRARIFIAPAMLAGALATLFFASMAFARPLTAPPAISTVTPSSATAGQGFTIVIIGSNFETTSTVTLNNTALSVDSATTDTITATNANANAFTTAGTFALVVNTSEGQATTSFQIVAGPATQSSIAPASANLTAGNSLILSATVSDTWGNPISDNNVSWSMISGSGTPAFSGLTSRSATFSINAAGAKTLQASYNGGAPFATASVTVNPATPQLSVAPAGATTLDAGGSAPFAATVADVYGNSVTTDTVQWSSSVGTFTTNSGNNTTYTPPTAPATYLITATLQSTAQTVQRQVNVQAGPATQVTLQPASPISIVAGNTAPFTATLLDAANNPTTNGTVNWTASAGSFNGSGNARTYTPPTVAGTYFITATLASNETAQSRQVVVGAAAASSISIAPINPTITAGNTLAFTALVSDSFGNVTSAGSVTWTVDSGQGVWSNQQPRSATFTSTFASPSVVRASIAGAPDVTTTVTVNPAGVAKITLTPPNATLAVNASQNFSAFAFDVFNNAIPNATFTWTVSNPARASVIANGNTATLTAKTTAGTFANLLRVNSASITQTAPITITPGAPSSIALTPAAASLVVSATQSFNATVFDAYNNSVPNTALIWSVSGAQVGQIGATTGSTAIFTSSTVSGIYPAGVRVSTGSITQTANITLTAGALSAVTLNPNGITITPTGSIGIVATGRDRFGNPISGLSFSWSVNGSPGSVTPAAPGSASATFNASIVAGNYPNAIKATTSGISGTANVLITYAEVARIAVTPANTTLQPTTQQVFFARGYDKFNNAIWPLEVSWNVSGTGLITKTGSVTATFEAGTIAGIFTNSVSASTQNITGVASITVTPGSLNTISVNPSQVVIGIGSQQPFNATGIDAWGNPVPSFSVNWSVSPSSAGSFDSTSATSALFRAGNTPGTYDNAVRASNGAVSGAASVVVKPGTVSSVSLSPTSVSLPINGVQIFTAAVLDQVGNPLPDLWVVWQVAPNAGTIESFGPLTVAVKAGTTAGTYAAAVSASNGIFSAVADLTIQAGPASGMNMSAAPATLQTNGADSSIIEVALTDAFGNPTGAGATVQWEIVQCRGECALESASSQTDAGGRARTAIRSNYRAPQGTTSTIIVRAVAGGLNKTITLAGQFTPFKQNLPALLRDAPAPENHTSCTALRISPPVTVRQPANNAYNIYRFTAGAPSYRVSLTDYGTSGYLQLYRITVDNCGVNSRMSVVYLGEAGITSPTSFETTFNNLFTPGQEYLLAVNTTGAFTSQFYSITIQP